MDAKRLQEIIGARLERAQKIGINFYGCVRVGDEVFAHMESRPCVAANVNKLAVARWVIDSSQEPSETISWQG